MAKKSEKDKGDSKPKKGSIFSYIFGTGIFLLCCKLLFIAALAVGALWLTGYPGIALSIKNKIDSTINRFVLQDQTISTLEIRYREAEIIAAASKKLASEEYTIGAKRVVYLPALLVEAKYTHPSGRVTEESSMVWDLMQGELILSLETFQETSGFKDCLVSQASLDDFRILHALCERGGSLTKEALIRASGLDDETACSLIESLRKRHLVTVQNDSVRVHVKNPFFAISPETKISRPFVQKEVASLDLIPEAFSKKQVAKLIESAYGKDLAILDTSQIWIPAWKVTINNPDGSTRTTLWNAISGREFDAKLAAAVQIRQTYEP